MLSQDPDEEIAEEAESISRILKRNRLNAQSASTKPHLMKNPFGYAGEPISVYSVVVGSEETRGDKCISRVLNAVKF